MADLSNQIDDFFCFVSKRVFRSSRKRMNPLGWIFEFLWFAGYAFLTMWA
ncbi:MAG: hypothetical protein WA474_21500 [Candidatus Sulfotelmatobacter sp.]